MRLGSATCEGKKVLKIEEKITHIFCVRSVDFALIGLVDTTKWKLKLVGSVPYCFRSKLYGTRRVPEQEKEICIDKAIEACIT